MTSDIKQLKGLSPEDRLKILSETDSKYKAIVGELHEISKYIDEQIDVTINAKRVDVDSCIRSLLYIIHTQSKLLTDIRLVLNKMANEQGVELQYIHLNLEILNQNISTVHDEIRDLKK